MATFICPHCNSRLSTKNSDTMKRERCGKFGTSTVYSPIENSPLCDFFEIAYYFCPECENQTVIIDRGCGVFEGLYAYIYPNSPAKQFPDYVPVSIRNDYKEACAIVTLSPKASATLSRRCLQGMIRDFWGVKSDTLFNEITAIKDKVHPTQWKAIDGVRKIGNIGAHMEKDINFIVDIDPKEAEHLIRLLELLLEDWYVRRHEQDELYKSVIETAQDKRNANTP